MKCLFGQHKFLIENAKEQGCLPERLQKSICPTHIWRRKRFYCLKCKYECFEWLGDPIKLNARIVKSPDEANLGDGEVCWKMTNNVRKDEAIFIVASDRETMSRVGAAYMEGLVATTKFNRKKTWSADYTPLTNSRILAYPIMVQGQPEVWVDPEPWGSCGSGPWSDEDFSQPKIIG